mmetsp:Transcript_1760/g.4826  ORF Transcript_1760/g.4826 Transcript_1760/m.4826 type:complete len:319 (-) Transcript_1760:118-1074(-)
MWPATPDTHEDHSTFAGDSVEQGSLSNGVASPSASVHSSTATTTNLSVLLPRLLNELEEDRRWREGMEAHMSRLEAMLHQGRADRAEMLQTFKAQIGEAMSKVSAGIFAKLQEQESVMHAHGKCTEEAIEGLARRLEEEFPHGDKSVHAAFQNAGAHAAVAGCMPAEEHRTSPRPTPLAASGTRPLGETAPDCAAEEARQREGRPHDGTAKVAKRLSSSHGGLLHVGVQSLDSSRNALTGTWAPRRPSISSSSSDVPATQVVQVSPGRTARTPSGLAALSPQRISSAMLAAQTPDRADLLTSAGAGAGHQLAPRRQYG